VVGIANYLNRRDSYFDNLMLLAVKDQNMALTRFLLGNGASPDITDDDTWSRFIPNHRLSKGKPHIAELLLT
jgi:hypothetical protein